MRYVGRASGKRENSQRQNYNSEGLVAVFEA
jgi:hypothetical protein